MLAFCLAHARREFFGVRKMTKDLSAGEELRGIAEVYAIEARTADDRRKRASPRL
jgi:Transposase IS66 family